MGKIMSLHHAGVEEVWWENIRMEVKKVNSVLADLIDQVEPSSQLKLFRVRYPFGAYIFNKGQVQLPIVPGKELPKNIYKQLNYSILPLGLLLNKKLEMFVETNGQVLFLDLINSGEMIGVEEFFNSSRKKVSGFFSKLTAGIRSIFFLTQISNEKSHRKLKNLHCVKHMAPKKILEHWHVFREICEQSFIENDWYCEVLFFSDLFVKKIEKHMKNYFISILYEKTYKLRERALFDVNWKSLLKVMEMRGFKTLSAQIPTIRNLLEVGSGLVSGLRPAIDEIGLPLRLLQNIYIHDYGLKNYAPIIMEPYYLMDVSLREMPAYYSLPFMMQFKTRNKQSMLAELHEIIAMNEELHYWFLKHHDLNFPKIHQLHYEYFYSIPYVSSGIRSTSEILKFDEMLAKQIKEYDHRRFPEKSMFLRGVILISNKS